MFRRRSDSSDAPASSQDAEARPVKEGGKGRPTPKRREAEKVRRNQLVTAPRDRKEAYRQVRERQAQQRSKAREGMARGDSRYLPKRDQGPVREFARDYVDSRRTVGSHLMLIMFVIVLVSFVQTPVTQLLFMLIPPVLLFVVLTESLLLSQKVKKLAAERFPNEERKGVGLYAATRSLQMRRLRIPNPRYGPGDKDKI
ncbi:DUF3043 domain-containing protein [Actinocorallia sp. B10E7]|uniref:DUF3043 domain-containing protein n=1 Tax=Actinocorallia sp. B10E7 TaxID=3153558 RepID=UPI00325EAB4B